MPAKKRPDVQSMQGAWMDVLRQDPLNLEFMPREMLNKALCWETVGRNPAAVRYVPQEFMTKETAALAVGKSPATLRFIWQKFRTPEMERGAVAKDYRAIQYVAPERIDDAMYDSAMRQHAAEAFRLLPDRAKTQARCADAFARGASFIDIPPDRRTVAMAEAYVAAGGPLANVDDRLKTQKMCSRACASWPVQYGDVPDRFKTPEMALPAVMADARFFAKVPPEHRTPAVSEAAVAASPMNVRYLNNDPAMQRLFEQAVERNPQALAGVPAERQTPKMCFMAVSKDASAMNAVRPDLAANRDFCMDVFRANPDVYPYLKMEKTQEMTISYLKRSRAAEALVYVDPKQRTLEAYRTAVSHGRPGALQFIPDSVLREHPDLCVEGLKAYAGKPKELRLLMESYVPEDLRGKVGGGLQNPGRPAAGMNYGRSFANADIEHAAAAAMGRGPGQGAGMAHGR